MKFRSVLAALLTAVALTACDKAEDVSTKTVEKAKDVVSETTTAAADKAAKMAEEAKEAAAAKAAEVAKAAQEAKDAAAAKAAEVAKAAQEAKEAAEAKAAEVAKAAQEAKAAAEAKAAEVAKAAQEAKEAAEAKAAEEAKAAQEAKEAAEAKAAEEAKAAQEAKAAAEAKAAEEAKVAQEAKEAAEAKAAEVAKVAQEAKEAAEAKAAEVAKVAQEAKEAVAAKAAEVAKAAEEVKTSAASKLAAAATATAAAATATASTMADKVAAKAGMKNDTKVGFVYVGPIGDHGWSYQHNVSRLAVEKALNVETTYVESVPEGADAERVIRQLAADGNDVIFTTSFGYMNPTVKVAKMFPNVKFEHATGYKRAPNVSTYSARFYEGRAILGAIAGKMTKTNTIGYVASFPIPEVIRGINAMAIAARKVNPDVKIKVIWVNTWFDPGKEGDAAKALIDQGADIITQHTDSPAPLQVAEQRGVFGFGQASDMKAFAPKAQLTSIIDNWDAYYIARVKAAMEGNWESKDTWDGIKSGMVEMAPYGDAVPADVREMADQIEAGIVNGSLHAFQGPIKNQAGEVVVKEGETIPDSELVKMNWYVEGVEGTIPK